MASSACDPAPVRVRRGGGLGRVHIRRPERRNAMDEEVIARVTEAAGELGADPEVRAVLLSSSGRIFCAGADIGYMRRAGGFGREENVEDAMRLAGMFQAVDRLPKPVLARVHGPVFGGGVGLVSACDMVFATPRASFCLSEVRLGILPAVIGPYVVRRVGPMRARGLFSTSARIRAQDAVHMGLVDVLCDSEEEMDEQIASAIASALASAPGAAARGLRLAEELWGGDPEALMRPMAELSAEARAGEEGREGLRAFLEKRPPSWFRPPPAWPPSEEPSGEPRG